MPTIYDVAKRAKVSTYTVSTVLNRSANVSPELTKRVLDAVRELDYTINDLARGLQTRRTQTLGMLIPDIANPFYAKVVGGVEDICKHNSYSLLLGNTHNDPDEQARYLTVFRSKQVDGFLLFCAPGAEKGLEALLQKNVPLVFLGRLPEKIHASSVTANNRKGMRLAMNHFLSRGHKRIALVTGPSSLSVSKDRVDVWKRMLGKAGLSAYPRYVREANSAESSYRVTLDFVRHAPRPTAVFTANFLLMTGVLRAMKEENLKCPQDVEVISSDDSEWLDVFDPPISTIVQPSYEMGKRGAELLFDIIAAPKRAPHKLVLDPGVKIRV